MHWFLCLSLSVFLLMFRVKFNGVVGVVSYSQETLYSQGTACWGRSSPGFIAETSAHDTVHWPAELHIDMGQVNMWPGRWPQTFAGCARGEGGGFWLTLLGSERNVLQLTMKRHLSHFKTKMKVKKKKYCISSNLLYRLSVCTSGMEIMLWNVGIITIKEAF